MLENLIYVGMTVGKVIAFQEWQFSRAHVAYYRVLNYQNESQLFLNQSVIRLRIPGTMSPTNHVKHKFS